MKEKFQELEVMIEDIRVPLIATIPLSIPERTTKVSEILSNMDSLANYFSWNNSKATGTIPLRGLHICHWIAKNIWVAAAEDGIYWHDYDKTFIDSILNTYAKELSETLKII